MAEVDIHELLEHRGWLAALVRELLRDPGYGDAERARAALEAVGGG